jgi:hypothetical protein
VTTNGDGIVIAELIGLVSTGSAYQAQLFSVDSQGSLTKIGTEMEMPFGTSVCSGFFSDQGYVNVVFCDIDSGQLQLYAVGADNSFSLISKDTPSVPPRPNLRVGRFHQDWQYTDLLSCTQEAGKTYGQFYFTDGKGGLTTIGSGFTYASYGMIRTGHFDLKTDITDLLFYTDGETAFLTTDGKGNLVQIGEKQTIEAWNDVVIGNFGGGTGCSDLMFVSKSGQAQFYRTPGDGTLAPIADPSDEGIIPDGSMISGVFAGSTIFDDILVIKQ